MKLFSICLAACFALISADAAYAAKKRCPKGFKADYERKVCIRIPRGSY